MPPPRARDGPREALSLADQTGITYFKTDRNGAAIFATGAIPHVWRIRPYPDAIAEMGDLWVPGGVVTVLVTEDAAGWLARLP